MLKKILMVVMLLTTTVVFTGFSEAEAAEAGDALPKWVLIHDVHYVMDGEDLDQIAKAYMKKNTYGPRGFEEFREGIIELNGLRDNPVVYTGQELRINYWIKPEEILNK